LAPPRSDTTTAGVRLLSQRKAAILEAKNLCKFYGSVLAVQNVTFTLEPGQVLGYLGPNGSGKSTTVKIVTGLLEPTHGEVTYKGQNIPKDLIAYRKILGYVPEEPNLYPHLTGEEYLDMVGTLRAMPQSRKGTRITSLLQLFSLWPHRHFALGSYSKGMRQKILLIAALMDNPDVLILDEPLRPRLDFRPHRQKPDSGVERTRQIRFLLFAYSRSRRESLFSPDRLAERPRPRSWSHGCRSRKDWQVFA